MLRILNKSGALKPSNVVLAASLSTTSARLGSSSLKDFKATNEPILDYKRDSAERAKLKESLDGFAKLSAKSSGMYEVPIVIGDKEIRTKDVRYQVLPFDHKVKLARFYYADKALLKEAIQNSLEARAAWESTSVDYRCQVLLKAADKLANEKRGDILAATMLGQGKTIFQAEIDAACELIDFFRFNVQFLQEALTYKPLDAGTHTVNNMQLRGLEGFVAAIAPFNFTAIAGNLASVPALMGNVVLFKPSDTAVYSSYMVYKVLRECGLPAGVINFVPANGADFGEVITSSPHLSGVNFTGSVPTFRWLWSKIGQNLNTYNTFPKISGECGGKNFHLIHESADIESAAVATVRSAFEYSGQKCSACSRLYVPESKWPQMRDRMVSMMKDLKIQSPLQFETFTSAVIDEKSFDRISNYIDLGKKELNLIAGGRYDKSTGYYIYPTMFETKDPKHRIMREELFGPVLAVYVYKNSEYEKAMELIDMTTPFALTGSIFAQDENVLNKSIARLKQACGNMYINDKSTGAVVNQQPFGGARLSGTNDKPGGPHNILKWTSPLSIKRYLLPQAESSIKHSSMV